MAQKSSKKRFRKEAGAESGEKKKSIIWIIKGLAVAFAITCIIFLICALVLTYTDISEKYIGIAATLCTAVSALAAGKIWATSYGRKGLITGALAGGAYAVILLILGIATGGGALAIGNMASIIVAVAGGGIGGILGVN